MPSLLPKFDRSKMPKLDRWAAGIAAAWIIGPGLTGWMFWSTKTQKEELTLSLEQAQRDSAHYATVIAATEHLRARRDTIAQKLQIIQDIDAERYTWAHALDEISRALPEYTWLTRVNQVRGDSTPKTPSIHLEGMTGTTLALTKFMTDLESSPFIAAVRLVSTEQAVEDNKTVYKFVIDCRYETPPPDAIETVPLFKAEE